MCFLVGILVHSVMSLSVRRRDSESGSTASDSSKAWSHIQQCWRIHGGERYRYRSCYSQRSSPEGERLLCFRSSWHHLSWCVCCFIHVQSERRYTDTDHWSVCLSVCLSVCTSFRLSTPFLPLLTMES